MLGVPTRLFGVKVALRGVVKVGYIRVTFKGEGRELRLLALSNVDDGTCTAVGAADGVLLAGGVFSVCVGYRGIDEAAADSIPKAPSPPDELADVTVAESASSEVLLFFLRLRFGVCFLRGLWRESSHDCQQLALTQREHGRPLSHRTFFALQRLHATWAYNIRRKNQYTHTGRSFRWMVRTLGRPSPQFRHFFSCLACASVWQ